MAGTAKQHDERLFRLPPGRCWYLQQFKLRAHTVAAALARWSEQVLALIEGRASNVVTLQRA
jgi:hypothetical protein